MRHNHYIYWTFLAEAQNARGAMADALETIEQALQPTPTNSHTVPRLSDSGAKFSSNRGSQNSPKADFRESHRSRPNDER